MTEIDQILLRLSSIPDGQYCMVIPTPWWMFEQEQRGGWISVKTDKKGDKSIMWTNGKDTHLPVETAMSLTISPSGELVCYMEIYVSAWVKWGYGRGTENDYNNAIAYARWIDETFPWKKTNEKEMLAVQEGVSGEQRSNWLSEMCSWFGRS